MDGGETQRLSKVVVHGDRVCFRFGNKRSRCILNDLNISVERGIIYGLLGPSGCGKTTLLRCILGRYAPSSGSIKIFGKSPGQRGFCVPGRGVGYMPQELALYPEITMEETLTYFGRIYKMPSEEIKRRIEFLADFLDIPDKKKQIKFLSGGQQRRVSFAAALVHQPPLVILDEPTVGVDPLLREDIWDHLQNLTSTSFTTVIITTHYLEEARKASTVGFMRNGQMLAEGNPEELIKLYTVSSLEDVFLKLCKSRNRGTEDKGELENTSDLGWESQENHEVWVLRKVTANKSSALCDGVSNDLAKTALLSQANDSDFCFTEESSCGGSLNSAAGQWAALTAKNLIRLQRNLQIIFFMLFFPAVQVIVFCLCIGGEPFHIPLAIVNEETDPAGKATLFLEEVDSYTVLQRNFSNLSIALDSVREGENWGVVHIPEKYTDSLIDRFLQGLDADNDSVQSSTIRVYMDMTNQQIAITIYARLLQAFQSFAKKMLTMNYKDEFLAQSPVVFDTPVYGDVKPNFAKYMAPGMITGITYIMAVSLSTLSIITEKKEGLLDRSWIAGVQSWAVISSIFFTLVLIMLVQVTIVLLIIFYALDISPVGSLAWVIIATVLVGLEGLSFGLFVSAVCSNEIAAGMLSMGSFFPILCLSGLFWSVEAMPNYMRALSYCSPLTLITETVRCVLYRGWGILEHEMWVGYLVALAWTIPVIFLSSAIFKYNK